jgi:hypothetical protein
MNRTVQLTTSSAAIYRPNQNRDLTNGSGGKDDGRRKTYSARQSICYPHLSMNDGEHAADARMREYNER